MQAPKAARARRVSLDSVGHSLSCAAKYGRWTLYWLSRLLGSQLPSQILAHKGLVAGKLVTI